MKYLLMLLLTLPTVNAQTQNDKAISKSTTYKFDLQGHRGARGLAPENTLQAFQKALELGVNTLELDLAVTKDKQIIVSHEPWMNADICLDADGNDIEKANEKSFNIYQMTYEEVKRFDCGSKYNPAFPEQKLESAYKPLLREVLQMADSLRKNHGKEIAYNIELKSLPEGDDLFHPKPSEFVKMVMDLLLEETDINRVNLQSFDFRVLKELHKAYPNVKLAALVYNTDFDTALNDLGFEPEIYSPYFPLVNKKLVAEAHEKGIQVIPWTVNELEQMKTLLKYGVDGLITDYPDRALKLKTK
ncbi:glycerophosphodiester phosphodiesterase [Psychroflexus montanilacus]|uniref:glycerophosphodiester phosphodiesterase n=1 Tax=Psychroflexus montanilacus TaxID=2873598 RepID=UPI001CCFE76B|nr:glycerophosphodiester phosphodiesterase [Psychroflexus montanilacus]MBZ9650978.1 glycerophosphodiester phosphodiesterase [Psychroflexus montanilacus]